MTTRRKILAAFAVVILASGLATACSRAKQGNQTSRPPDLAHGPVTRITQANTLNTGFGESVDVSGDTVVIGATDFNVGWGDQIGSVYVYRRAGSEWVQQARLASSDGLDGFQYDQHFGRSVAIEGDTIAVGAPDADHPKAGDDTGAVYVFRRAGESWEEIAKLEAPEPRAHDRFGNLVRLHGDTLAIAGDQEDALYAFAWDGRAWVQQARLAFPLPPESEWRQVSLALHGDTLAAGVTDSAYFDLHGSGRVFVYQRQGDAWTESARLEGARDFGAALALGSSPTAQDGQADTLVVGASGDSSAGLYAGAVYIYGRQEGDWKEQAKLTAADAIMDLPFPSTNQFFGSSVALQGDLLLVQSRPSSDVYIFQGQGASWIDQLKVHIDLIPDVLDPWPVAIDGTTVVRGSPGEFGNSAHVFEIFTR